MGPEVGINERIVSEAVRWHARLAAPDCTDAERCAFERWCSLRRAHAEAYAAVDALCAGLTRRAATDDRLQAMADEAFAMGTAELPGASAQSAVPGPGAASAKGRILNARARRWLVPASLAASIALAFVGAQLSGYLAKPTPAIAFASTPETRRDVTLSDGSVVHLDVDSEIRVSLSASRRDIVLVDGRALFEVAHDASRPFTVAAGRSHTTALGTRFQVQRAGQHVLVTLAQGSVAVTGGSDTAPWRETLAPGEQMRLTTDGLVHAKRAVDTQLLTSWSRGRLVFRGTPLGEALEEINRYADRKVRLGDPDLADLPVGGNFIAGESDLIVSAFAAVLPLRMVDGGAGEIILFRRYQVDGH